MMELDEAIKHAEEVANECTVYFQTSDGEMTKIPSQCAEEHRQLAEWLKELKRVRELPWLKELKELRKEQRPHGEWIETDVGDEIYGRYEKCTNCGEAIISTHMSYCGNCGAKMGEGV